MTIYYCVATPIIFFIVLLFMKKISDEVTWEMERDGWTNGETSTPNPEMSPHANTQADE